MRYGLDVLGDALATPRGVPPTDAVPGMDEPPPPLHAPSPSARIISDEAKYEDGLVTACIL
jgi:hypothetical protein